MTQIASDGIYFTEARSVNYVAFVPATRQTVIISCSSPGTYYLTNYPDDQTRSGITDNETRFYQNMVTLVVSASTYNDNKLTASLSTISRPYYLADLTNKEGEFMWEMNVEQPGNEKFFWLGMGVC
jgi:FtsP/CotA-like multicopper oxidase with cupredoxin domain